MSSHSPASTFVVVSATWRSPKGPRMSIKAYFRSSLKQLRGHENLTRIPFRPDCSYEPKWLARRSGGRITPPPPFVDGAAPGWAQTERASSLPFPRVHVCPHLVALKVSAKRSAECRNHLRIHLEFSNGRSDGAAAVLRRMTAQQKRRDINHPTLRIRNEGSPGSAGFHEPLCFQR